jgi:hypothetical protein
VGFLSGLGLGVCVWEFGGAEARANGLDAPALCCMG